MVDLLFLPQIFGLVVGTYVHGVVVLFAPGRDT